MSKFLHFENVILETVGSSLPSDLRGQFFVQLGLINKVQRSLEWKEIEFYCMRWFKVKWPSTVLFRDKGEFLLGSGTLSTAGIIATVKVWAVGGHVFSIESEVPLRQFKAAKDVSFAISEVAAQPEIQADGK